MAAPALNNVRAIRPDLQVVEQRVADLDDGYVRLATMILEEMAGADFTKRQFKVILAVIRLTYGWNKARDRIANSQISEIARLPVKRVSETRVQLLKMNVLTASGQQIGLNKNVSEWVLPQCEGLSLKAGDKKSLKLGDSYPSKQGDTIDIIPKTVKTTTTPIVPTEDVSEPLAARDPEICEPPPPEQPVSDQVRQVFTHWQAEHNHPTAKLDDKRRKRIQARLAQGFTAEELCKAITGAKFDTWLMGKNPSNKRYDGIDTLLRDAAQVEKLRDLSDNEHARAIAGGQYSATTARNLDTLQRWAGAKDTGAPF